MELHLPVTGKVVQVVGAEVVARGLRLAVGDSTEIDGPDGRVEADVVAVRDDGTARLAVFGDTTGITRGAKVRRSLGSGGQVVGRQLLGRVVDALGHPVDGKGPVAGARAPIQVPAPDPLTRGRIRDILPVGVRVLDLFCTVGRGQRIGLFAGSGVGKSTLLGMMARGADADAVVICLVGERGREVREFLEDDLGPEGAARSVVVVATSDQPAMLRARAPQYATAIAEDLAAQGLDVLFLCDSLTRLALAQRELGLAAGEPPAARGYTPSVFSTLPKLLERTGPQSVGTITAFYTVLVDGDDHNDPIADAVRGILDGHVVLDRRLAHAGRYPAVDPLASISRLAAKILPDDKVATATQARAALAAAESVRDLVEVGAYAPGSNPDADRGLELAPALITLCQQSTHEVTDFDTSFAELADVVGTA